MLGSEIKVDRSRPVSSQIVEHIKRKIKRHELRAGDRLPTISELVAKTGVGNYSIRKAISELNQHGVLNSSPGKGVYVSHSNLINQDKQQIQNFAVLSAFRMTSVGPKISHPQTVAGIFNASERFNCKINLVAPNLDTSSFRDVLSEIKDIGYDGIIWLYPTPSELVVIEQLSGEDVDLVVTSHSRLGWEYPCVESDEGRAGALVGKHFAQKEVDKLYFFWEPSSGEISHQQITSAGNLTFLQSLRQSFNEARPNNSGDIEVLTFQESVESFRKAFLEVLERADDRSGIVFANTEVFRGVLGLDSSRIVNGLRNHEVVIATSRFENNMLSRLAEDLNFYTVINPLQDIGKLAVQKMVNLKKGYFEDTTTLLKVDFKPYSMS